MIKQYLLIAFSVLFSFSANSIDKKGVYSQTYGNFDDAVGNYLIVNNNSAKVEVLGFKHDAEQAKYVNRDHVGYYIGMYGPQNQLILKPKDISYAKDGFFVLDKENLDDIKLGMFVSTISKDRFFGRVIAINQSKGFVTISGWYKKNENSIESMPDENLSLVVNSADKIWGQNTNVFINKNSTAKTATGYELGFFSDGSHGNPVWGFHAVNLSNIGAPFQQAFRATGKWSIGFYSSKDVSTGFVSTEPRDSGLKVLNNESYNWGGSVISLESNQKENNNAYLIRSIKGNNDAYSMKSDGTQSSEKFEVLKVGKTTILSSNGPSFVLCNNKYAISIFLPPQKTRGMIYEIKAASVGKVKIFYGKNIIELENGKETYSKFISDGND